MSDLPPTRWSRVSGTSGYGAHFGELVAAGADVEGEARLADALLPRGGSVLDLGAGMGRVAAALTARGHRVVPVEPDPRLVEQARATYPDLEVRPVEALAFETDERFDLVVLVGNVMIYLGEGTEQRVLRHVRSLLADGGRVLVGFHLTAVKDGSRTYPAQEFVADVAAAGLRVDHRFGSYELHPPADDYAVWVLSAAG